MAADNTEAKHISGLAAPLRKLKFGEADLLEPKKMKRHQGHE